MYIFKVILRLIVVSAIFAIVLLALPLNLAFAQDTTVVAPAGSSTTVVTGGPLWAFIQPYLEIVVSAVITALIALIATVMQRTFNVTLTADNRNALHSAAVSGVNMALSKLGTKVQDLQFDTKSAVVAQAIDYIETSVPDALNHFGVTPQFLEDLVESKLGALINAQAAKPATVVVAPAGSTTIGPAS